MLSLLDLANVCLPYLFLFWLAYSIGWSVQCLSIFLDKAMDYGNILSGVRYWTIYLFAIDKDLFKRQVIKESKNPDVYEIVGQVDIVYKTHARWVGKLILCPECFGFWILLLSTIGLYLMIGLVWSQYWVFILFSFTGFKRN